MRLSLEQGKGTLTLRIEGELDALSVSKLKPVIAGISEDRPPQVLVDLAPLRLIDSCGVAAIVSLFKSVRGYGGELAVSGLRDQPLAIFRLLHLDCVLVREVAR